MHVRFPISADIKGQVKRRGFVARALLMNDRRKETLPVEIYKGKKVEPQNFGYIAGTSTHVTSGLEHCTLLSLFDHRSQLGAAGHFLVRSDSRPLPEDHRSLNDFLANVQDMQNTLELMGANRNRLQAFCAFGITSPTSVAPVLDVLQALQNMRIPVTGVSPCWDGDFVYQSNLRKGRVNFYLDGTSRTKKVFEVDPSRTDRAAAVLDYADKVIDYFNGICENSGREEFLGAALPYLAAKYFTKPELFLTYSLRAVDKGSEKPLQSKDPNKETIGEYFRGLVRF